MKTSNISMVNRGIAYFKGYICFCIRRIESCWVSLRPSLKNVAFCFVKQWRRFTNFIWNACTNICTKWEQRCHHCPEITIFFWWTILIRKYYYIYNINKPTIFILEQIFGTWMEHSTTTPSFLHNFLLYMVCSTGIHIVDFLFIQK